MNGQVGYNFVMNMIHNMLLSTLKVIFDIEEEELVDEWEALEKREDCKEWISLYRQGKLPQAEQVMIESLSTENIRDLERALLFYDRVNRLEDEQLAQAGIEREDLRDSVRGVLEMFECGDLGDALIMD